MGKNTREHYRLSVKADGRLYKALSHSVEEDETLFVMNRNPRLPRHLMSGIPQWTQTGLSLNSQSLAAKRAHHVHYHPSGLLVVKALDGCTVTRIQVPPMPMLSAPFLMFHLSVARIDQLAIDHHHPALGDHIIDISEMEVRRLQIECWVGPKHSFDGHFEWAFGSAQRIVYEDAGFYDVAYFVGEGAPIDPFVQIDGVKLKDACLTAAPSASAFPPQNFPNLEPEAWASPPAIARQIRALMETRVSRFGSRLGFSSGCYEIRISLCDDGAIAALDWNPKINMPQFGWIRSRSIGRAKVLELLRRVPQSDGNQIVDVFDVNPCWCGGLPGMVYARIQKPSVVANHNALVFNACDFVVGRYWRIPPLVLANMDEVIDLIHSR